MIYHLGERRVVTRGEVYVAPNATVIGSVVLEQHSSVWFHVVIRGDSDTVTVGENSNIQDGSVLHTDPGIKLTVGCNVSVGHMVMLHGCTIGDGSLIGIQSVILNHAVIGCNSLVGAGTLIPEGKQYPDGVLILGRPGRVVRELTREEILRQREIASHYVENGARYRRDLRAA
jgi:carbonic anhydrase/acetyltransferase-like protein (isoleucine patch superfamily)